MADKPLPPLPNGSGLYVAYRPVGIYSGRPATEADLAAIGYVPAPKCDAPGCAERVIKRECAVHSAEMGEAFEIVLKERDAWRGRALSSEVSFQQCVNEAGGAMRSLLTSRGLADDPTLDATDAASPAWRRGHDNGAKGMAAKVERLEAKITAQARVVEAARGFERANLVNVEYAERALYAALAELDREQAAAKERDR